MSRHRNDKRGQGSRRETSQGPPKQPREPPQCPTCLIAKQRTGMEGSFDIIDIQFKQLRNPLEPEGTYAFVRLGDRRMSIQKILEQFDSRSQLLKDICMFVYERALAKDPARWQIASKTGGVFTLGSPLAVCWRSTVHGIAQIH